MSSRSQVKLYISRGVQTEDNLLWQLPRRDTQSLSPLDYTPAGELAPSSVGFSSENVRSQILGALAYEGAYTRPQVSEYSELLPLTSYKKHRYAGLDSASPSNSHLASKRVVSLPDPSVQEAVITERNLRIVSMPEFTRFPPMTHRNILQSSQANSSFSSDASHNSVDPGGQRWSLSHNRMYPLDIPHTPSPPSSPDSVVIIGNEPHVSGAFLRRSCRGDDGWVTWASSPPRPIPALHGPLSLPYARCPSGAEGTVIEGDDLSHKIWGLGAGDTQNNAHTNKAEVRHQPPALSSAVQTNVSCRDARQLAFQQQRLGDDVIDLSTIPSAFYTGYQTIPSISEGYISYFQPDIGLGGEHSNPKELETKHGMLSSQRIGHSGAKRYHSNSSGSMENFRTGLDLPVSMTHRGTGQFNGTAQPRLNKAAPIFIPSIGWNSKCAHVQQNENDASVLDHQYSRRAGLSQQRHIELLTPPSTSSPRWSPVFSHPVDIELSKGPYGDPKIYSPRADLDDYSNKLMLMIQQIKQQDMINSAKRYSLDTTRQTRDPLVQKSFVANNANQYRQERLQVTSGKTNASQPPSDFRHDLSQQHPRSIPLARLIQRRLSSVAEENSPPPLLQTAHPRVSLEPLIYRSSTDRLAAPITTEAVGSIVSSQPTAETIYIQPGEPESNAIVKLPRNSATHGVPRTSSGFPSKRPPRNDTKKDKDEIVNGQDKVKSLRKEDIGN